MTPETIAKWHQAVARRDMSLLADLLAEEVVFHSPIVHTPQIGKKLTTLYLGAAVQVLANDHFRYTREIYGEQDAVLEFSTVIDDIVINGVDMIHWDHDGKIDDFKVMLRPLKAINLIHQLMAGMLHKMPR